MFFDVYHTGSSLVFSSFYVHCEVVKVNQDGSAVIVIGDGINALDEIKAVHVNPFRPTLFLRLRVLLKKH